MKIKVLAFGIAKDIIGGSYLNLEVPADTTVHLLKERLRQDFPSFDRLSSLAIAVNAEYVTDEQTLREQDEIVLIPPVSGG